MQLDYRASGTASSRGIRAHVHCLNWICGVDLRYGSTTDQGRTGREDSTSRSRHPARVVGTHAQAQPTKWAQRGGLASDRVMSDAEATFHSAQPCRLVAECSCSRAAPRHQGAVRRMSVEPSRVAPADVQVRGEAVASTQHLPTYCRCPRQQPREVVRVGGLRGVRTPVGSATQRFPALRAHPHTTNASLVRRGGFVFSDPHHGGPVRDLRAHAAAAAPRPGMHVGDFKRGMLGRSWVYRNGAAAPSSSRMMRLSSRS